MVCRFSPVLALWVHEPGPAHADPRHHSVIHSLTLSNHLSLAARCLRRVNSLAVNASQINKGGQARESEKQLWRQWKQRQQQHLISTPPLHLTGALCFIQFTAGGL